MIARNFVIDDYDAAVVLWNEVDGVEICEGDSRAELLEFLERNPGLSRVAEQDGQLIGAALCGHDGRRGWIYHLAVSAAWRGSGVGKLLLDECIQGLHRDGIKRAMILVARDNPRGQEFWRRNGWEELPFAVPMARDV